MSQHLESDSMVTVDGEKKMKQHLCDGVNLLIFSFNVCHVLFTPVIHAISYLLKELGEQYEHVTM